jgi:hypothetical protein
VSAKSADHDVHWRQSTTVADVRSGCRVLIVAAAGLYFVLRVWTYLVFAADRLDFADAERSTAPLTATECAQFAAAFHVNDPRWILNLLIFAVFLAMAFLSRTRDVRTDGHAEGRTSPVS